MGKYVAALYAGNRIVTGVNHGDAFSKLNTTEQDGEVESGFLDPETGKFFTEEYNFYMKQVYLVRHGDAEGQHFHASLTDKGREQCKVCGEFLAKQDLKGYDICCSPLDRCVQSAEIFSEFTTLPFHIEPNLRNQDDDEPDLEFLQRISSTLEHIPAKALLISHSDFIVQFIHEAIGPEFINDICVGNCAVTLIDARRIVRLR